MTRGRKPRRGSPSPSSQRTSSRPGARAWVLAALVVVSIGAATVWRYSSRAVPPATTELDAMPTAVLAESTRAALQRQDWERAQRYFDRLLQFEPRDPSLLLGSALAWHNHAWLGGQYGRERSATRTSLDRIEIERRALALMDSAAACARNPEEWARARTRVGQTYEHLGLFIDALQVYRQIEARDSSFAEARLRRAAIVQRLRSP